MKKGKLIIRVNGGEGIGMGHVFRTLAIADYMRSKFNISVFYIINNDHSVKQVLNQNNFDFESIKNTRAPEEIKKILTRQAINFLPVCLFDSKSDLSHEMRVFKESEIPIVLIDNITNARFVANLNIYPVGDFDYKALQWNAYKGKVVSGREWIPIREKFLNCGSHLKPISQRKNILVTMGGIDKNLLTVKVMEALKDFDPVVPITLVTGFSPELKEEVYTRNVAYSNRFKIIENTFEMENLMADSGLAITALGFTIYELACMGIPTIAISNYKEDKPDEKRLQKYGFVLNLGYYKNLNAIDLRNAVALLWKDMRKREQMSGFAYQVIDGLGAERISNEIQKLLSSL